MKKPEAIIFLNYEEGGDVYYPDLDSDEILREIFKRVNWELRVLNGYIQIREGDENWEYLEKDSLDFLMIETFVSKCGVLKGGRRMNVRLSLPLWNYIVWLASDRVEIEEIKPIPFGH